MSEYCYKCIDCGEFKEECICERFKDPMELWRNMTPEELMEEEQKTLCENCEEQGVKHKGDWCNKCNLPKKGDPCM